MHTRTISPDAQARLSERVDAAIQHRIAALPAFGLRGEPDYAEAIAIRAELAEQHTAGARS